jgi:hypothetical protein
MGVWRLHKAYSPYLAEDLDEIDFVQSAISLYFVHLNYPPQKLTRAGHTDWTFAELTFGPLIAAPANVNATPSQPNATGAIATTYTYYVTAIDANGQESRASTPGASVNNDLSLQGNYNTVSWNVVADAEFYAIYKGDNATPGYIGLVEAPALSFKDRNLISIASDTPPRATNPFTDADSYPSTATFHQQRLTLGRTRTRPNAAWGSVSADPENFDVARPAKPDDALSFALVTEKVNSLNQLISLKEGLGVLGGDSIFSVKGGEGGAMTPAAIVPNRESGRGSSRLNPILIDQIAFYQSERSFDVRALGFTFETEGYRSNNVSIFSPHFFKGRRIVSWAYQSEPYSCIWAALDDGSLLCFTWEEEQEVWGWTKMELGGYVERVAVIHEGGYDRLYALIRRTIGGVVRRFHERLALPHVDEIAVACHLDCAVTQISETPSAIIDQLWHLEGETVSATYDGYAVDGLVVENGRVTLPHEANIRTAGIPYEGTIKLLPLALNAGGGTLHTERQAIGDVVIRTTETRGLEISTDGDNFDPLPERDGSSPWLLPVGETYDFKAPAPSNWEDGASLTIRHSQPLPAHVTAVFLEIVAARND